MRQPNRELLRVGEGLRAIRGGLAALSEVDVGAEHRHEAVVIEQISEHGCEMPVIWHRRGAPRRRGGLGRRRSRWVRDRRSGMFTVAGRGEASSSRRGRRILVRRLRSGRSARIRPNPLLNAVERLDEMLEISVEVGVAQFDGLQRRQWPNRPDQTVAARHLGAAHEERDDLNPRSAAERELDLLSDHVVRRIVEAPLSPIGHGRHPPRPDQGEKSAA